MNDQGNKGEKKKKTKDSAKKKDRKKAVVSEALTSLSEKKHMNGRAKAVFLYLPSEVFVKVFQR